VEVANGAAKIRRRTSVRYLLMIYDDETKWGSMSEAQQQAGMEQYNKYSDWLTEKGWMRGGDQLAGTDQATTVKQGDGNVLSLDGPFAETKEQLGGYYVIECENLDEAIEAAGKIPSVAFGGSVEVRPLIDM
jgi:hypothetical protein